MRDIDFSVFSDGSGHVDGLGGWAVLVQSNVNGAKIFRAGAIMGTTVDRAELIGILEGLQIVEEIIPKILSVRGLKQHQWTPNVMMYSDRENLVLSIQGAYARSNSPDLWTRFEYYEKHMHIEAHYVKRDTDHAEFVLVDREASTMRLIVKSYADNTGLPGSRIV
jgi:ribonuclease HI